MISGVSFAFHISLSSAKQRQSPLPLLALLASADRSAVADDVGRQLRHPHLAQQRQSLLPLLALLASADPSIVADDVRRQLRFPHLAQHRQRPLPLLALLASADPSVVAMTLGSSFASRISRSSAKARCHSSPFSQALIAAL
ncbi:unnamed protein product [Prorocentrum cordatum]|uniref:HEAT repeat-containing protein 1 n=1 Tax=Prorocentrum cordatum TaxID=2364126 RepID=A0ABN9SGN4_9DINO|nr:unnamed protein product [Polarella glacialis]